MRIWVDLAHSPHPLFFGPILRRLRELGHEVLVTARDSGQTAELAKRYWPDVEVAGGASPGGRGAKAAAIAQRVAELRGWARSRRPDVALSHNSYAQIAAARLLRIPAVTAMDYEHQPANHLAFRLASRILLPSALPLEAVRRQGARPAKVRRYEGLKEELYLAEFQPDPGLPGRLGVRRDGRALVVLRAPPTRTLYHRNANPIWPRLLALLAETPGAAVVALARDGEQRAAIRRLGLCCPTEAVDSRALLYEADLVVGAGGTMTREAALLGVPTVSVYSGPPPAVDLWLERRGLLRRAASAAAVGPIRRRDRPPRALDELRARGDELVRFVIEETLAVPV